MAIVKGSLCQCGRDDPHSASEHVMAPQMDDDHDDQMMAAIIVGRTTVEKAVAATDLVERKILLEVAIMSLRQAMHMIDTKLAMT